MKEKKKKKEKRLYIRVSDIELEQIKKRADDTGKTVSKYLLEIGLSGSFEEVKRSDKSIQEAKVRKKELVELANIGNNINQIARYVNTQKDDTDKVFLLLELQRIVLELEAWRNAG